MKSSRDFTPERFTRRRKPGVWGAILCGVIVVGFTVTAHGELPGWIRNIEAKTGIEGAFFRAMSLPYGEVLYRRPPSETRPALGELIQHAPETGELYSLRALEDEQQLDFAAAETDWKLYATKAANKSAAKLELADFYHRRLRPQDEIATLRAVADAPADSSEKFVVVTKQRSWSAFERIFGIIQAQGLPSTVSIANYQAWIARYPKEEQLYSRFLGYLVDQKDFAAANQLIAEYQKQFPSDAIFAVKAKGLVEYRQGSLQQGLAVYEKSFKPLWDPELVKSYFDLLGQTQSLRKFLDRARAELNANPGDLKATARVFYYYQQQGKLDAAQQAITSLRLRKEGAKSAWTAEDLYICGRLLEDIHAYPEAARYYFALYNSAENGASATKVAQERALSRLTDILLTAPEAPIRLGSGELSLYKDIATLDQGPGYLNGILSLILNSTSPESEYPAEEQRAVPYFHRARAAELLALLDKNFPDSANRAESHAKLLEFYASSGKSEIVLQAGKEFLAEFPKAEQRTQISLLMADAYERLKRPREEFAIYDAVLQELSAQADGMPLGARVAGGEEFAPVRRSGSGRIDVGEVEGEEGAQGSDVARAAGEQANAAFQVKKEEGVRESGPRSPEYSRVLERYLARLVETKEIPEALGVLRREIDHNPDDPGLYERLAVFLEQNHLGQEQEEVYRRAMARFPERSWYSKLARYYLRYKKNTELEKLTQDAVKEFAGTELESYFQSVGSSSQAMYVRLNQYANGRFPHNPYFVRNLLYAYHSKPTYDHAAWLALIRQHWFEEADLRNRYFEYLSSSGQLEKELRALRESAPVGEHGEWDAYVRKNPAAGQELADAEIWRSHFEQSAPLLKALAAEYPAATELDRTASSVFRSLAYFDPANTFVAAKIEESLFAVNPGDTEVLSRIGDIYADREMFTAAAPYWERIPKVAPGESSGYLEAATIYWDYFDFDNALRLLNDGRKKLGNATLYGYEEGAILEGKRDYPGAVREYANSALAANGESPALNRLLELARRPKYRELVNEETEKLAAVEDSLSVMHLRVRVLEAENRKAELIAYLNAAVDRAKSMEQAAEIETIAQQKSLEDVRQRALEKQASLAVDPVTRLQLRYQLVRLYESRKDFASAQRNVEALYRENPKILGVVRATVDFYWRMKAYPQGIAVLRQAAKDAYPQLAKQFTFEAARKSTEAKEYQQARALLDDLLKDAPYNSEYLAAMADTYAQAGDAQGLKEFYLDKIAAFCSAPFTGDERKAQIATLRRGLIPALTQLKEYGGAVDQYIELLNNYPEDEALATEAALYGLRYQREKQLLDFYAKTVQQSPRDFRWPMVLARMQTSLEDFPAAIESYGKAIAIRPDRTDLRIARAALDERLLRFDDAASDYDKLYQLAYKDPKWMEKVAEVRARQGRNADAVAALKTALIDVEPERAANYFEVARRLEGWGILTQAREFAEQGVRICGDELLASAENHEGAKLYARIMTRLRLHEKAYATLQSGLKAASDSLPVLTEQVAKQGIAGVSNREWRERTLTIRKENAESGMRGVLVEMGGTAGRYFTPEEKVSFGGFAQTVRASFHESAAADNPAFSLVRAAGLAEIEAQWRYEVMMSLPARDNELMGQMGQLVQLQRERLKFAELGQQLEKFVARIRPEDYGAVNQAAAEAYRAAGDEQKELDLLSNLSPGYLDPINQARFLELMLKDRPQQLVKVASQWTPFGQTAADYAVLHGNPELAQAVVAARSHARPAVWQKSYTALVGMYFSELRPAVNDAFGSALGNQSMGERLGKAVERDKQLAGDVWFYYGSRYGEYLGDTKQGVPEDYLPASVEQSPASSSSYQSLGDYYFDKGDSRRAIEQYNYTLELSPDMASVHDKLASAYLQEGNRAQAITEWKKVFVALLNELNKSGMNESFWADFGHTCEHVQKKHLFAEVQPDVDQLLRAYLHRNGNYRSNALVHSAYIAQANEATATAWLLEIASSAPDPVGVLTDVVEVSWVPLAQRGQIYQRILEAKKSAVDKSEGLEQENATSALRDWQLRWVKYLVDTKQFEKAKDAIAALRQDTWKQDAAALVPYEMQVAAHLGNLDAKIAAYKAEPQTAPSADALRTAARRLFEAGDKQSARKILEFVFARELEEHQLVAANFLGLAEIRIAAGDTPEAVSLLKRLVLVVGDPYANMDSAAALLEKTGHPAEAIGFLEPLGKSTPWEANYRLRLAKAQLAVAKENGAPQESLAKIAADGANLYAVRVQAAEAFSGVSARKNLGSGELDLLASGVKNVTPASADHAFFYDERLAAAQNSSDANVKMRILASVLADTPSRDDARLPFFRAAESLRLDETALASIEQLLRDQRFRQIVPRTPFNEEEILNEEEANRVEERVSPVTATVGLQADEQAATLRAVGNALARLRRLDEAAGYLREAQKLEKAPVVKKAITAELLDVRSRVRREKLNQARQPILHEELEQNRLVRPRLVARAVKPAKPVAQEAAQP